MVLVFRLIDLVIGPSVFRQSRFMDYFTSYGLFYDDYFIRFVSFVLVSHVSLSCRIAVSVFTAVFCCRSLLLFSAVFSVVVCCCFFLLCLSNE